MKVESFNDNILLKKFIYVFVIKFNVFLKDKNYKLMLIKGDFYSIKIIKLYYFKK